MSAGLLLGVLIAPNANATTIACYIGHYYHRFDGYHTYTTTDAFEGAKADITSRFGYICDTDTTNNPPHDGNFTTTWVMVQGNSGQAYSQAGIMRYINDASNHLFAEYQQNMAVYDYHRVYGGAISFGDVRTYWTQYLPGTGSCTDRFRNNWNTTVMQTTDWSPYCDTAMTRPWLADYESETLYPSTDVDGINGSSEHFANMQDQNWSTNGWEAAPNNLVSDLDNPTTGSDLANFCTAHALSCDTFAQSAVSSQAFNSNTTNPH